MSKAKKTTIAIMRGGKVKEKWVWWGVMGYAELPDEEGRGARVSFGGWWPTRQQAIDNMPEWAKETATGHLWVIKSKLDWQLNPEKFLMS